MNPKGYGFIGIRSSLAPSSACLKKEISSSYERVCSVVFFCGILYSVLRTK